MVSAATPVVFSAPISAGVSAGIGTALFATALASLAVERTTAYGGGSVDPVSALDLFKPIPYLDEDLAPRYAERFGVTFHAIPTAGTDARLKFAPPRNQMMY